MKKNMLMAWRNLWRNKRRTLITVASVFFGVLLCTVMSSVQEGSYEAMIGNIVKLYSGYIQVHHEDYWANKTINNSFVPADSLVSKIRKIKDVTVIAPRLESFALASSEELTKGSIILGIDPEPENKVTELKKWLQKGDYLLNGDQGILIASELARYLKLDVGDTLVMIGQGYHGVSAAGKFPVRGILHLANPELNRQAIYMDLAACQDFYTASHLVTALVLMVEDPNTISLVMKTLRPAIKSPYSVMAWDEMQPEVLQMINADRQADSVVKLILYVLIGFGIFGTVMMMIVERQREMGVMIAIGMRRFKLALVLLLETFYIGIIGVLAGFIGSIPVITWFIYNPIRLTGKSGQAMIDMGFEPYMYFSLMPRVFYEQIIIVFLLTLLVSFYPIYSAKRLEVHNALHG